ncbi:lipid droplet-regulating VLDL assembly factor AUP1 isoform X1 [Hypomesus transpacificus]|uniref:lipid droplet-regulating VLDL assembly factor AUP1 isoform X1 n=1 Tax=Hypomesus transpacificus TaxID=137520 RepID=UPI001F072597|nr:lipid droplet-regulating VLDL assembly factor AUP1 isoform X1 [Hypomesus transpacificus]
METRGIEHMFDFQRLPNDGLVRILLLIYSPIGLCLMLIRIFIGVHVFLVSCALPDSLIRRCIVRIMCSVLGMHVRQNNPRLRDKRVKLYICNHVTEFDHNIINLLTSCNTPMLDGSAGFVCWARGFMELGPAPAPAQLQEALQRYSSSPGTPPLLLFPEEDTTNGRAGMLKFSLWPFSVTESLQPVALQVKRPFLSLSIPESSWLTELLWTFFVPCTVYHVRWLPAVSRQEEETLQDFTNKVQQLLAAELSVASTQITKADKAEHIKRKRHVAPHINTSSASPRPSPRGAQVRGVDEAGLSRLALQVKDVLPDVPLSVITSDLVQTNCVDATITNLLESTEEFSSEPTGSSAFTSSMSSSSASSPPAVKCFGKSPVDRHMSLQERKEALYDFARRRYIEKHGL